MKSCQTEIYPPSGLKKQDPAILCVQKKTTLDINIDIQ